MIRRTVFFVCLLALALSVAVMAAPVQASDPAQAGTPTAVAPTPTGLPGIGQGVVLAAVLRVRNQPLTTSRTVLGIRRGDVVTILGYDATKKWVMVRLKNGQIGWVSAAFVKLGTSLIATNGTPAATTSSKATKAPTSTKAPAATKAPTATK